MPDCSKYAITDVRVWQLKVKRRAVRLQQVRDRLTSETEEERAARLQRMSPNQRHRLAAETGSEERPDYSVTGKGKEDNSHSCICLNTSYVFHVV